MPEPLPLPTRLTVAESIDDYLADCRARGLRMGTIQNAYGMPLRASWLRWCGEHGIDRMDQVAQPVVTRWMADLRDRVGPKGEPLSPHTVKGYGVAITRWLRWAEREGHMEASVRAPRTRTDRAIREVITDDEYRAMLEAAITDRDRLAIQLLWETGMRASELLQLRVGDLVRHDGRWFLRVLAPRRGGGAKDSRERFVPLQQAQPLRRYLAGPRARLDAATDHIFVSRRRPADGGPRRALTVSGLEQLINSVALDAGITHHIHPHLFRHTTITRLRRARMDPMRLAAMVGHSSLQMIFNVYDHADHRDVWDELARVSAKETR